jgi:hypothetical protein
MNAWKSGEAGRQMPPVIVEVAKGTPSVHSGVEESAFKERWQGLLGRRSATGPKSLSPQQATDFQALSHQAQKEPPDNT